MVGFQDARAPRHHNPQSARLGQRRRHAGRSAISAARRALFTVLGVRSAADRPPRERAIPRANVDRLQATPSYAKRLSSLIKVPREPFPATSSDAMEVTGGQGVAGSNLPQPRAIGAWQSLGLVAAASWACCLGSYHHPRRGGRPGRDRPLGAVAGGRGRLWFVGRPPSTLTDVPRLAVTFWRLHAPAAVWAVAPGYCVRAAGGAAVGSRARGSGTPRQRGDWCRSGCFQVWHVLSRLDALSLAR